MARCSQAALRADRPTLVMGSVTTELVRHATAPLLVVRPFATQRVVARTEAVQRHGLPMLAGGFA